VWAESKIINFLTSSYKDLPLDTEVLRWWAEREASLFAEKCAGFQPASRVDRAATADKCDYIRKWLGYSRNFATFLGLEVSYHLYEGMPFESKHHATFKSHINIIHSIPGFPHDTLFAPTSFLTSFVKQFCNLTMMMMIIIIILTAKLFSVLDFRL
jgi:hypothetical protein